MTGKRILKHITSKIAILAFLATLVAATTANATQSVKCSSKKASCPNTAVDSACTLLDSDGIERDGAVRLRGNSPYCSGIVAPKPTLQQAQLLHKDWAVTEDVIQDKSSNTLNPKPLEESIVIPLQVELRSNGGQIYIVLDDDSEQTPEAFFNWLRRWNCIRKGGTYYENSNGGVCAPARDVATSSKSAAQLTKPTPEDDAKRSERRQCIKDGYTWVSRKSGSMCMRPLPMDDAKPLILK